MRYLSALALLGAVTQAFQDTSPFIAFVAFDPLAPRSLGLRETSIAESSYLSSLLLDVIDICPTNAYVFVSQPGVTEKDFSDKNAMPHLRRLLTTANDTMRWHIMHPQVVGRIDVTRMQTRAASVCDATTIDVDHASGVIRSSDAARQIINVQFPELSKSPDTRAAELLSHDSFLNTVLNTVQPKSHFVIYTTTPLKATSETVESTSAQKSHPAHHTDLKRDLNAHESNTTAKLPLFERYAYFSPGIFSGLLIFVLLFPLLYVGVTAISSLEIPVAAFSKENGPAAQKKQ